MAAIPFFTWKGTMAVMGKSFTLATVGSPIVEMVRRKIPKIPYQVAQVSTMIVASGVACYYSYHENVELPEFFLSSVIGSLWGSMLAQFLLDLEPRPTLQGRALVTAQRTHQN